MKIKLYFLVLCIILLSSCGENTNSSILEDSNLDELLQDGIEMEENMEKLTNDEKLDAIKQKLALKGIISKGDMYFADRDYATALAQYLKALNDIPNDSEINLKIGNIYYEQKKFDKAYEYYNKIKSYSGLDKEVAIYSLINSSYKEEDINKINKEIDTFALSKEESFYYKNSLLCISNFSKCRANFDEYFSRLGDDYVIEFTPLKVMQDTFTNYDNFLLEDLLYKDALVTGAFYKNGFYFVALNGGEEILKTNKDYKPILKIVARSAYELGNYTSAKNYMIEYNKLETKDAEASYFMGRIYEKLGEKLLSTVHFDKALNLEYPDSNDIRRRLIFIYYDLEDTTKMINNFKLLIDSASKDLTINDYNLAIYYLLGVDDLETAKKYSEEGKSLFPNSELFYSYYAWIMLQNDKLTQEQLRIVKDNIDWAIKNNTNNPIVSLVEGMYYIKTLEYDKASLRLENALLLDKNREYRDVITSYQGLLNSNSKANEKTK